MKLPGGSGKVRSIVLMLALSLAVPLVSFAQEEEDFDPSRQPREEARCIAQRGPEAERRYTFREVKWPWILAKAYGPRGKRWYEMVLSRVIPGYKVDLFDYKINDIRFIEGKYGRTVPLGETERSQKIRREAEKKLKEANRFATQQWENWLAGHPNASDEEKNKVRNRIFAGTSDSDQLPRFDWRDAGLDLLPARDQGFYCNSCWAFSTVDAMQISRQLDAMRADRGPFRTSDEMMPSVPRLASCMMPKTVGEELCSINWHGEAFSYMVDHGLPLGSGDVYDGSGYPRWQCDKTAAVKALTWDFVSSTPQNVPTNDHIKRALVTYGPLVATMNLDSCLMLYGDGVFDEEQSQDGPYHMLLIAGWDDERGAWLVKNSFGAEWGDNGFGWVKYGSNNIGKWAAWIMADPRAEAKFAAQRLGPK
jgi:C1A family cysteine protease